MTMTIDLTREMETQLRQEAAKEGMAPDHFILSTVEERLRRNHIGQDIPRLSKVESELMQRINEGLPLETWHQYHELVAKCHAETLSLEEHQELIKLTDQVEIDYAHRLGLVLELANIHGVSLEAQMQALSIPQYSGSNLRVRNQLGL